jgi:hypothetical protein
MADDLFERIMVHAFRKGRTISEYVAGILERQVPDHRTARVSSRSRMQLQSRRLREISPFKEAVSFAALGTVSSLCLVRPFSLSGRTAGTDFARGPPGNSGMRETQAGSRARGRQSRLNSCLNETSRRPATV